MCDVYSYPLAAQGLRSSYCCATTAERVKYYVSFLG